MKKLNFFTGGHPFRSNDLLHLQNALIDIVRGIVGSYNDNDPLILWGIEGTSNSRSEGYIYFDDEIFKVDATTTYPVSGTVYYKIQTSTENPENLSSPYTVVYQNSTINETHVVRKMQAQTGSGDILASNLQRVTPLIDKLDPPTITWNDITDLGTSWEDPGAISVPTGTLAPPPLQYQLDSVNQIVRLRGVLKFTGGAPSVPQTLFSNLPNEARPPGGKLLFVPVGPVINPTLASIRIRSDGVADILNGFWSTDDYMFFDNFSYSIASV